MNDHFKLVHYSSLRWYYPVQVQRVKQSTAISATSNDEAPREVDGGI